jgi:PEP-CTERM motif
MIRIVKTFASAGLFFAVALSHPALAAEHTLTFKGYVDGVNPVLGSQVNVGDEVSAQLTYRDDGVTITDNGTYRYYNNSFVYGSLNFGGYNIDLPDANGAQIYSQNSEPGFGPDRFIFQFSGLPVQPMNGFNFYGLALVFDDGDALAFDGHVLPTRNSDLSGFIRAGAILDFGEAGMYRIGGVLPEFSFASVPEPTTWALMLIGFGIAGTQIRARRHQFPGYKFRLNPPTLTSPCPHPMA